MSLASLKIIHHVYSHIADIYESGAWRVDSRGFFFRILKRLHLSHPFTPLTAKRETYVIAVQQLRQGMRGNISVLKMKRWFCRLFRTLIDTV